MSDDAIWFYERNGKREGPVESASLKELLSSGEISQDSLVWKEGMSDWAPLRSTEVEGLKSGPRPPAIPNREAAGNVSSAESERVLQPANVNDDPIPKREAVLREGFRVGIRSSLARAWELMKSDFWPFVGLYALMSVLLGVASQLYITVLFMIFPIMVGYNWYVLRRMRGQAASIDDLFFGFKRGFGALALLNLVLMTPVAVLVVVVGLCIMGISMVVIESGGGNQEAAIAIIVGISVLVGLLFILVAGVITMVGYFASLLIVDCDWPWKRALSTAWQACRGNLFKLALFYFSVTLLSFLGVFALYIGAFITGAWGMAAVSQLYEDAFGDLVAEEQS